jgi:hypothetical protein
MTKDERGHDCTMTMSCIIVYVPLLEIPTHRRSRFENTKCNQPAF